MHPTPLALVSLRPVSRHLVSAFAGRGVVLNVPLALELLTETGYRHASDVTEREAAEPVAEPLDEVCLLLEIHRPVGQRVVVAKELRLREEVDIPFGDEATLDRGDRLDAHDRGAREAVLPVILREVATNLDTVELEDIAEGILVGETDVVAGDELVVLVASRKHLGRLSKRITGKTLIEVAPLNLAGLGLNAVRLAVDSVGYDGVNRLNELAVVRRHTVLDAVISKHLADRVVVRAQLVNVLRELRRYDAGKRREILRSGDDLAVRNGLERNVLRTRRIGFEVVDDDEVLSHRGGEAFVADLLWGENEVSERSLTDVRTGDVVGRLCDLLDIRRASALVHQDAAEVGVNHLFFCVLKHFSLLSTLLMQS